MSASKAEWDLRLCLLNHSRQLLYGTTVYHDTVVPPLFLEQLGKSVSARETLHCPLLRAFVKVRRPLPLEASVL